MLADAGSIGKLILGMKRDCIGDKRLHPGRALLRNLVKLLSWASFGIGFLMASFSTHRQALHDKVSGCLVVRRKAGQQQIAGAAAGMRKVPFAWLPSLLLSLAVVIALGAGFRYVYLGVFLDPSTYDDPKVAGGHASIKLRQSELAALLVFGEFGRGSGSTRPVHMLNQSYRRISMPWPRVLLTPLILWAVVSRAQSGTTDSEN